MMMPNNFVPVDVDVPIWDAFFIVAPLVVVGTREGDHYDFAPKHMAMPLGWQNYFGFVCSPRHATYHNARNEGVFTVSFPRPDNVVLASLTASPRCDKPRHKPVLDQLPTIEAEVIDGLFLRDSYLYLECELDRIVEDLGQNSLLIGQVVAAYVHEDAIRASELDDQELIKQTPLLAYLSPGRYASIEHSYSFPFPADYQR